VAKKQVEKKTKSKKAKKWTAVEAKILDAFEWKDVPEDFFKYADMDRLTELAELVEKNPEKVSVEEIQAAMTANEPPRPHEYKSKRKYTFDDLKKALIKGAEIIKKETIEVEDTSRPQDKTGVVYTRKKDKVTLRRSAIWLREGQLKHLKIIAAAQERNISDIMQEIVDNYIEATIDDQEALLKDGYLKRPLKGDK